MFREFSFKLKQDNRVGITKLGLKYTWSNITQDYNGQCRIFAKPFTDHTRP